MNFDEICQVMSTKSGARSPEEWADFFSLPPELQEAEARLIKSAVFARDDGPTAWDSMLSALETAGVIGGAVAGVVSGYQALKSVL